MTALTKAEAWAEIHRRARRNRLYTYIPYPKQMEFHAAGRTRRERLLIAGNQEGKTFCGGCELAYHLTGLYPGPGETFYPELWPNGSPCQFAGRDVWPEGWPGARFARPVTAWCGAESNELSREILQAALLGTEALDLRDPDMGTGAIPGDCILKVTPRQAGVRDVADQVIVKHVSGGKSRLVFKTYEQGAAKWTGKKVDIIWPDEEPPEEIYSEALTRTQAAEGGMVMMTFTPLKGMSGVVARFLNPPPGDPPRHVTNMTIEDALHYTADERKEIIAAYPPHERDTRSKGVPMMGEGRVWPVDENAIKVDPFPIPRHFARICGLDFGIAEDHPFAAAWIAWDRDNDTIYVYDGYRVSDAVPAVHCDAIKRRGDWIPVAWPHDGVNKQKDSGKQLHRLYREHGLRLLKDSARYDKDVGGTQPVEPVVIDILERMVEGRFKVFANLGQWFEEFRMYHRKDGKIVAARDDLISATRTAMLDLRHARIEFTKPRSRTERLGLRMWN